MSKDKDKRKPEKSQATKLVELASKTRLFHDPEKQAFAVIENSGHFETLPIRSKAFRVWLSGKYYSAFNSSPGNQAIQDAIGSIEGKAIYAANQAETFLRIGGDDQRVIIDLGNESWNCVVIDRQGWRIRSESPIHFRRSKGLRPLPTPVKSTDGIELFSKYANIRREDLPLILGWLIGAMRPTGPYPILLIHGEQGSAKSTTSRFCRQLIDPNFADLRSSPRNEQDLVIQASNSWVFALENLSSIPNWLSDSLCRMATGGGFATRELYENNGEAIFNFQRPALINGIEEIATRSDLIDRSILLNLPTIKATDRKTEKEIFADFQSDRGKLLGMLLDAVSMALRNLDATVLDSPPRLADFAQWVVSSEKSFGWNGEFLEAYQGNREGVNQSAIEANIIGKPLIEFIRENETWEGTSSDLLDRIEQYACEKTRQAKDWPKSARAISGKVRRIAPNLRQAGYEVETDLPNRSIRISLHTTVGTVATVAKSSNLDGSDGPNGQIHTHSNEVEEICPRCKAVMIPSEELNGYQNWDCPNCEQVIPKKVVARY